MLVIDIETKSECDIKKAGAWAYSLHPSTEVMCMVATDMGTGQTRRIDFRGVTVPKITDFQNIYIAHNIAFERAILENTLGWDMSGTKWIDTQDIVAYMGAPLSLAGAAEFLLGDSEADQKDKAGRALMLKICTPSNRKKGTFKEYTEEDFIGLMDYCEQDVHVSKRIYEEYAKYIPEDEWKTMAETQEINHHGIPVDLDLVDRLEDYYQEACAELEAPEGFVKEDVRRTAFMLKTLNDYGYPAENMQALTVETALKSEDLHPTMRSLLETRQILTMASVKKLKSLKAMCAGQPYFRNGFQYHGAKTGRYSGRGAQPQNLPRGFSEDIDIIMTRLLLGAGI
jgi:DNA polymerase